MRPTHLPIRYRAVSEKIAGGFTKRNGSVSKIVSDLNHQIGLAGAHPNTSNAHRSEHELAAGGSSVLKMDPSSARRTQAEIADAEPNRSRASTASPESLIIPAGAGVVSPRSRSLLIAASRLGRIRV